jgi:hypothetical protein
MGKETAMTVPANKPKPTTTKKANPKAKPASGDKVVSMLPKQEAKKAAAVKVKAPNRLDLIEQVLVKAGRPMTVTEITAALKLDRNQVLGYAAWGAKKGRFDKVEVEPTYKAKRK